MFDWTDEMWACFASDSIGLLCERAKTLLREIRYFRVR